MSDNKDYILNIRISKDTYNKLKNKAKENSESLSSLVRKSLGDSMEIFGDLKSDLFGGQKGKNDFVHYQSGVTARDTKCYKCERDIKKGEKVQIGETATGKKKYFCSECA